MKKIGVSFFFLVMTVWVAGCNSTSGVKNNSEPVIGFSQMENNNPWRIAETESIRNEAKKQGYKMVYTDAQGDTARQLSAIEDMIAQGVDYIVLAPREYKGLGPALASAKKAGVPVIFVDRLAEGKPGEDYETFIGSDFIKQGERAAEWLVKEKNGQGNIVELTGTTGASVAIDRAEGFRTYLEENAPEMKIIASQTGDFARSEGQKVMESMLQSNGKNIDAVYAHNDEMAIGAINAIKAAGYKPGKDITVVSVDGTRDALKSIIKGEMGATVESSPFFGPAVFDVIKKLELGEKVNQEIIIKDRFFDKNNAEEFLDKAY